MSVIRILSRIIQRNGKKYAVEQEEEVEKICFITHDGSIDSSGCIFSFHSQYLDKLIGYFSSLLSAIFLS